jgi:hypothetical protein
MSIILDDSVASQAPAALHGRMRDILETLSRALSAAHYYQTLKVASGEVLTRHGLNRGGLPRATLQVLVGERDAVD